MISCGQVDVETINDPETAGAGDRRGAAGLTRESVLAWLTTCSEEDAIWLLAEAARERPDAYGQAARASLTPRRRDRTDSTCPFQHRVLRSLSNEGAKTSPPIVQFASFMYFCYESHGSVRLDLLRMGNLEHKSEVRYRTVDVTARAGTKYRESAGSAVFEPGAHELDIDIPLIDDTTWDTTTEFKVVLSDPSGCVLGLLSARVKIMDDETFPSSKHQEEILSAYRTDSAGQAGAEKPARGRGATPETIPERLEAISQWSLLMEYFKLNFANPVVRRGTIKLVIIDQLHNLYFIMNMVMTIYMVDVIFIELAGQVQEGRMRLIVLVVLMVVPFAFLHLLDHLKLTFKIGGGSRMMLQKALVRKYLNYTEDSRNLIKHADLIMAMTRDSDSLVHDGYVKFLGQFKVLGKFAYILAFQVGLQYVRGTIAWTGFAVIGLFPVLLFVFLRLRSRRSTTSVARMNDAQNALVGQVDRVITNFRMIGDYNRRSHFVNKLEERCKDYNGSVVSASMIHKNNQYAAKWLTTLFVAIYTLLGGISVIEDPVVNTLGMFLANVHIIKSLGDIFEALHVNFTELEATLPALLRVVMLLNMPVDLKDRLRVSLERREATSERRDRLKGEEIDGFQLDYLPIQLDLSKLGMAARSSSTPAQGVSGKFAGLSGTMSVMQGSFVAMVGPMGHGKTTLLKILGGVILPEPGCYFVPSYLRLLHVGTEVTFFLGTMYENLTFGCPPDGPDREMERVLAICKKLCLSEKVLKLVQQGDRASNPDAEIQRWGDLLSLTDKSLCQLARALIANPEILCVHKPTMPFSDTTSRNVLLLLKEFCVERGVELDPATRQLRRPRTCIVTCSKALGVDIADEVFMVDMSGTPSLRSVDKHHVTDSMMN